MNRTPGPLVWACWRRSICLAQAWRSGLGRQRAHAGPVQRFPRAAAAASDSGSQEQQPLFPSPRLEQRQQEWQVQLEQVAAFQRQHGWVPRQRPGPVRPLVEGEVELGRWCAQQRRRRDGSWGEPMSAEKAAALCAIPGWDWETEKKARRPGSRLPWEEWLKRVAAFAAQRGRLPRMTAGKAEPFSEGEQQLGKWCGRQRRRFKGQGTGAPLTAGQVAELEALPGWFWEEFQVQPWEQRLHQVADFVAQHGRLPRMEAGKAQPLLDGEQRVGVWCHQQRQRQKSQGSGGPLTLDQVAALETLPGWFWEEFQVHPWEQRLQQVAAFVEQHGRLPRRRGSKARPLEEGEAALGSWVEVQRQRRKGHGMGGPLVAEKEAALEAFPWWRW